MSWFRAIVCRASSPIRRYRAARAQSEYERTRLKNLILCCAEDLCAIWVGEGDLMTAYSEGWSFALELERLDAPEVTLHQAVLKDNEGNILNSGELKSTKTWALQNLARKLMLMSARQYREDQIASQN